MEETDVKAEAARLSAEAAHVLEKALRRSGLQRQQLAAAAGKSRSRVTTVLSGGQNLTLESLARFGLALGVRWKITQVAERAPRGRARLKK
jgi:antitoxin component HigA of HigAB toxin-antitoxin module